MATMTTERAKAWIQACATIIGQGYHPDTPGIDYIDANGDAMFTDAGARQWDAQTDAAMETLAAAGIDPYEVAGGAL